MWILSIFSNNAFSSDQIASTTLRFVKKIKSNQRAMERSMIELWLRDKVPNEDSWKQTKVNEGTDKRMWGKLIEYQ